MKPFVKLGAGGTDGAWPGDMTKNLTFLAAGEPCPGAYIHIPFCLTKCPYCAFNSEAYTQGAAEIYLRALIAQTKKMADHPMVVDRRFATLFIGGGTPTVFTAAELATLLETCLTALSFVEEPEITIETNPNTVTLEKLRTLRVSGVNRLSIGVQSFAEQILQAIGRSHDATDAGNAITLARAAGFTNINLDLMYGLPHQTDRLWEDTLRCAIACAPEHLAVYELTVEAGTPFAAFAQKGKLKLPSPAAVLRFARKTEELLAAHGYERYEVANYSRPGFRCRHNLNYWANGSYLGLGAGAFSCFSGLRFMNQAQPARYSRLVLAGEPPFAEGECLMREARFRETVIMGLRLVEGVSLAQLWERFQIDPRDYYGDGLKKLVATGLIELDPKHLRLTRKGFWLANQVLAQLV